MTKQFREAQIEFYMFFYGVSIDYYLDRSSKNKHWAEARYDHSIFTSRIIRRAKRELSRTINKHKTKEKQNE